MLLPPIYCFQSSWITVWFHTEQLSFVTNDSSFKKLKKTLGFGSQTGLDIQPAEYLSGTIDESMVASLIIQRM